MDSEVIIVDEDSPESKLSKSSNGSKKRNRRKKKRSVIVTKNKDEEMLVVTQQVKIEKQKFKCIINLTNICEHKQKRTEEKCIKTPPTVKVERIVPQCLRKRCLADIATKCCSIERKKRKKKRVRSKELDEKDPRKKLKCHLKKLKHYENKLRHHSKQDKTAGEGKGGYLSPISDTNFSVSPWASFEDISSDSFTISPEEPVETLIKRTKDREKRLSKSFEYKIPERGSLPKKEDRTSNTEIIILSEGDSYDSSATLVLEPQEETYSPTYPTLSPDHIKNYSVPYFETCEKMGQKTIKEEYSSFHFKDEVKSELLSPSKEQYLSMEIIDPNKIKTEPELYSSGQKKSSQNKILCKSPSPNKIKVEKNFSILL